MADSTTTIETLKEAMTRFAAVRGWEPYHTPKNLTMALSSEVGELCDIFRWLTPEESVAVTDDPELRQAVADELADIANIVFLLSHHTKIDLSEAITAKRIHTELKYPIPKTGPDADKS